MAMNTPTTFKDLSPNVLVAILSKIKPLNELVLMRQVSKKFNRSIRKVLKDTKVLEVNYICKGVTESILPYTKQLSVIPNTPIDPTLWQPDGYFASALKLARHCPNIEFFHWALPNFILSYGEHLQRVGKQLNVKLVRANYQYIDSADLVLLLARYWHIDVFADGIKISEFVDMPEDKRNRIASRIVTITSHELFSTSSIDLRTLSTLTSRLQSLDIILKIEDCNLIPRHFPRLKHLRMKDLYRLKRWLVSGFQTFIINHIARYESFGLMIEEAKAFDETLPIVQQLVRSGAKFRCGPEELEGTRLILGADWSVEVKPFKRKFITHINFWHPVAVEWLYELFPPLEHRPIRLYAISPLSPHGPLSPEIINAFLHPLANIRALHIKMSSCYINSIYVNCLNLRHLRLRIVERDRSVDLGRLDAFFTVSVARYESFSLSIDENMSDDNARNLVMRLAELGAKFRYSEQFGYPFLRLGNEWYVTSCTCLCIRRWPIRSSNLFTNLFRPTKKLHIRACKAETPDAISWRTSLALFSAVNHLRRIDIDFITLHNDEPALTDH